MNKLGIVCGLAVMTLAACEPYEDSAAATGTRTVAKLPDGVMQIVSPAQDLSSVRIDGATGCYEYRHKGPVETTYLPLRTKNGSPICTRKQS